MTPARLKCERARPRWYWSLYHLWWRGGAGMGSWIVDHWFQLIVVVGIKIIITHLAGINKGLGWLRRYSSEIITAVQGVQIAINEVSKQVRQIEEKGVSANDFREICVNLRSIKRDIENVSGVVIWTSGTCAKILGGDEARKARTRTTPRGNT